MPHVINIAMLVYIYYLFYFIQLYFFKYNIVYNLMLYNQWYENQNNIFLNYSLTLLKLTSLPNLNMYHKVISIPKIVIL